GALGRCHKCEAIAPLRSDHSFAVLPPLGPSAGVTEIGRPTHPLRVSAEKAVYGISPARLRSIWSPAPWRCCPWPSAPRADSRRRLEFSEPSHARTHVVERDLVGAPLRNGFIRAADGDPRALSVEFLRCGQPDPAIAAGDKDILVR